MYEDMRLVLRLLPTAARLEAPVSPPSYIYLSMFTTTPTIVYPACLLIGKAKNYFNISPPHTL